MTVNILSLVILESILRQVNRFSETLGKLADIYFLTSQPPSQTPAHRLRHNQLRQKWLRDFAQGVERAAGCGA